MIAIGMIMMTKMAIENQVVFCQETDYDERCRRMGLCGKGYTDEEKAEIGEGDGPPEFR